MVVHGDIKRKQTKGRYWWNLLESQILNLIGENIIPIISDCRYDEWQEDEVWWVKEKMKGILIYVTRYDQNNKEIPPANEKEIINNPKIKKKADYLLNWPTSNNKELLESIVREQLSKLIDEFK
jgi:hypothetical protein